MHNLVFITLIFVQPKCYEQKFDSDCQLSESDRYYYYDIDKADCVIYYACGNIDTTKNIFNTRDACNVQCKNCLTDWGKPGYPDRITGLFEKAFNIHTANCERYEERPGFSKPPAERTANLEVFDAVFEELSKVNTIPCTVNYRAGVFNS
ncbi:hypothetical protein RF11_00786 [Thelohanellus kitauei]|uniref:BPTI/Kunitz inhibitor domain-containing protein n=1 Tax=Thelohanellus kitauei TaxID=669202 RepID=A0A0C2JCH2_THEKT|nr:hypothetical protein RF11_00786 [Thelohanellus kitauei]